MVSGVWCDLAGTIASTVRRSIYAGHAVQLWQFINTMDGCPPPDLALMQIAVECLYATHGQVRIEQLAADCGLSLRQFERRFKQCLGLSPKLLARLIRFETLRDRLIRDSRCRPADLAYEFGYTDQSHLIRDFKALAGFTPAGFVAQAIRRSTTTFYYTPDPRPRYNPCVIE